MKLLSSSFLFFVLLFSINISGQKIITTIDPINKSDVDTISKWQNKNIIGFYLNEIVFSNWNAGGVSSVSGLLKGNFTRIYAIENSKWFNELIIRYGVNKQDGNAVRKSDDAIRFNSTFGYKKNKSSNWYHSLKFNFNTQFTNGYKYPNNTSPISKPFSPAYTFLGIGGEYFDKEKKLNVYISPFTFKNTLVLDQILANKGAFGVTKAVFDLDGNIVIEGESTKTEVGFLVTAAYKKEIIKNVNVDNRVSLYSDYINNFGNIDVDWELAFNLVVNQHIKANVGAHLVYDDDIKVKEEIDGEQNTIGPKIQLKQALGIGLEYTF
jgi:hypothetical protein